MATTLNPSTTASSIVLSNGNLTAKLTSHANWQVSFATTSHSSGKWYFEVALDTSFSGGGSSGSAPIEIGVCTSAQSFADTHFLGENAIGFGNDAQGFFIFNNLHAAGTGLNLTHSGHVIGVAVDLDNGAVYLKDWSASPAFWSDPMNEAAFTGFPVAVFPAIGLNTSGGTNAQVTLNFGATSFTGTIPQGFAGWDSSAVSQPPSQFIDPRNSFDNTITGTFNDTTTKTARAGNSNWTNSQGCGWQNTGKYYCEFTIVNAGVASGNSCVGIGLSSARDLTNPSNLTDGNPVTAGPFIGWTTLSVGYFINSGKVFFNSASSTTYATGTTNDVFGMAADFGNKKLWWQKNGGNWNNDVIGNQNPANNTGGFSISSLTGGQWAPAVSLIEGATTPVPSVKCNFGAQSFTTPAPSGFLPWRTGSGVFPFGTIIG